MSIETFAKCLRLFRTCENSRTLRLHNFGEVLLHPHLAELIQAATIASVEVSFFTNGVQPNGRLFPVSYWKRLAEAGLRTVDFSSHVMSLQEFKTVVDGLITIGRVFDPLVNILATWAGQTGPAETPIDEPCLFERDAAFVVLWNGRISSCCLDVEGERGELWINDLLRDAYYRFEPIPLCGGCASMRHHEDL